MIITMGTLTIHSDELLNPSDDLVPVSVGTDSNVLELIMPHLNKYVHCDLLFFEDVLQLAKAKAIKECPNAQVFQGKLDCPLRLRGVSTTISCMLVAVFGDACGTTNSNHLLTSA